jgi:4-diphosphocytidyl-2-C-methyl-D-erythritol kinase
MRARCPAKVNLHLEIGAQREDGYHELATIFQAVDLWDVLEASPASGVALVCDDPGLGPGEDNLVVRAARALQFRFGVGRRGARLSLRKTIPVGGGLGGGSSDAAGALMLLTRLWKIPASSQDLEQVAGELGSDVAFFLRGGTAVGTGRGECVEVVRPLGERPLVLGIAPFPISTAEVYRRITERRAGTDPALTPPAFGVSLRGLLTKLGRENDFGAARNDLEEVVLEGWPELAEFRQGLRAAGARLALVSGSGSTVFGLFEREADANAAVSELSRRFPRWRTIRSRTLSSGVRLEP